MSDANKTVMPAPEVGSTPLLAWVLSADFAEASVIVFAQTRNKAKGFYRKTPHLWDLDWIDIRVRREPKADSFAGDKPELLDGDSRRSEELMHSLGWRCLKEPTCEWCGCGSWPSIPASHVAIRCDLEDEPEICEVCYQAELVSVKANVSGEAR